MQAISNYIPHRGKMQLIDVLLSSDNDKAVALTTPRHDSLFITEHGMPAVVGIEYLAQTVAAFSCAKGGNAGEPKIGLLLGSRYYRSKVDFFPVDEALTITVTPRYLEDDALGIFEGTIELAGEVIVSATLNVFEPHEISDYLTVELP